MKPYLYPILAIVLMVSSCATKTNSVHYCIPEVMPEDLQTITDSSRYQFTMFCTYSHICDFCREDFPKVYTFCKTLPIDFYVLFHVRATDSLYIYDCMEDIKHIDSTFENYLILSDSLYDAKYRNVKSNGLIKHYGGHIEGNKYCNYVDKYIPQQFDHTCATPKLILYEKNNGIVFVNQYDEQEQTFISSKDKETIKAIVTKENN